MATKKEDATQAMLRNFETICDDLRQGRFASVYLLHGEESYFIDRITDLILENVLTEEEKDFNLSQYYGADVENVGDVVSACRRYPMMAERQLVLFREMQAFDNRRHNLDDLILYIGHPLQSTVFVMICKTKKLGEKLVKQTKANGGIVFESIKVPDYKLIEVVKPYILARGLSIDDKALKLLCDCVGSDLSRMFHEIDKMCLSIKSNKLTSNVIAEHVGVSKDFNASELVSAIAAKDRFKVDMIRRYFVANPKANPIQRTLVVLFGFFTNLMLAHYSSARDYKGLMYELGVPYPVAKDLAIGLNNYTGTKTMTNVALIREYDARCKGARNVTLSDAEALQELLFQLML